MVNKQWGNFVITNASTGVNISFPITFPTSWLGSLVTDGGITCYNTGFTNVTNSGITIYERNPQSSGVLVVGSGRWFAVGK